MDHPLNATAGSLLGFLHDGPMTGWDLVATAQRRIGEFWSLTRSQVYRELSRMADAGLVEAGQRGARDKRPYRITHEGREAFADWIRRPPGAETIRFPLLLTIAFGRHLPVPVLASFIARHRIAHADRLAAYERQRRQLGAVADADPFAVATLDFGIAYERAVLDWFDDLPPGINAPGPG
jgi:DNA-binding PadR family transcriptional regulator